MFVCVLYVDNARNVKTNRGEITANIYCLSHFLALQIIINTNTLYNFMQFSIVSYYTCILL